MINDEKYDTGKIFLSSLLSQAIISSVDILKTVAEFITRYRNLDFGEVDEKARQLNLIFMNSFDILTVVSSVHFRHF